MARRIPTAPCLALALWPILQACTTSESGAPLVTRYDSAGIRIVESYRPLWGDSSHWQVDAEPVLDLAESGTGDPHNFYSVRGMKRLSDLGRSSWPTAGRTRFGSSRRMEAS